MLNVNLSADTPTEVRDAIVELRRKHVSRFPIDVVSEDGRASVVRFVDTRFPTTQTNAHKCLAILDCSEWDEKMRRIYKLRSRLIQNQKYASHNANYHVKETTDPAKLVKLLRDYAKPFTAQEIMWKDVDSSPEASDEIWRSEPRSKFTSIVGKISADDVAEELMYLNSIGVQFRSEKFRRVIMDGIELYSEAKRRKAIVSVPMYVYIQPDDSVMAASGNSDYMEAGAWTYQTLEEAPQCVQQQVAMLRMCTQGEHIPEVGRKVSDNRFWIHVNPDDFKATNS